jgi:uncharacterized protein
MRRSLTRGKFVAGGAALAGLTVAASAYMAHVITRPRRIVPVATREIAPEVEDITFRTDDGLTLHGWYLPHDDPRDALVVSHGFAMSRVELLDLARGLRARGHAVLLFDFRAHGASEGGRSTIGYREAEDVAAAARFLAARPELAGRPIGALGLSMGAVATIGAAAREPLIAAVVADSGYATLHAIAAGGLRVLYRLPAFPFAPLIIRFGEMLTRARIGAARPIADVGRIAPRPLLIIHGERDRLIPLADAHALHAAAGDPKELWTLPGIDHARAFHHAGDEYLRRLDAFFTAALAPTADAAGR